MVMLIWGDFYPIIIKAMFFYTAVLLAAAICIFWFLAKILGKDVVLLAFGLCTFFAIATPFFLLFAFINGWFAPLLFHMPF